MRWMTTQCESKCVTRCMAMLYFDGIHPIFERAMFEIFRFVFRSMLYMKYMSLFVM